MRLDDDDGILEAGYRPHGDLIWRSRERDAERLVVEAEEAVRIDRAGDIANRLRHP